MAVVAVEIIDASDAAKVAHAKAWSCADFCESDQSVSSERKMVAAEKITDAAGIDQRLQLVSCCSCLS